MKKIATVDEYTLNNEKWKGELILLRDVFLSSKLVEEIKWGIPTYTVMSKNVAGFAAFKNYVAIWFYNGAFQSNSTHYSFKNFPVPKTFWLLRICTK